MDNINIIIFINVNFTSNYIDNKKGKELFHDI